MNQIEEYLGDYYHGRISAREISELVDISEWVVGKEIRKISGTYNDVLSKLEIEDKKLKKMIVSKYSSLKNRCLDSNDSIYYGLTYLSIQDYVEFCNGNIDMIHEMWVRYTSSGKDLKYALSIDRVDKRRGYILGNLEFVSHGYNSWKDNITPIKVLFQNKNYYFLSSEEGSRFFNVHKRTIGACLRLEYSYNKKFEVEHSEKEIVLHKRKKRNLKEYYKSFIENKGGS